MKHQLKKIAAMFLAVMMIATVASVSAFAANSEEFQIENGVLMKYNGSGGDIVIPEGVTSFGRSGSVIFGSRITGVTIPRSMTTIGNSAFFGCSNLTRVTLHDGVTAIESSAFWKCKSLESITIPNSVTSIGQGAFYGCHKLTSITIPSSVTSIGANAFYDSALTSITIPGSVETVNGFSWCQIASAVIQDGVKRLESAFASDPNLKTVTIPASVTYISGGCFQSDPALTDIYFAGSKAQWDAAYDPGYSAPLTGVTIHYGQTDSTPSSNTTTTTIPTTTTISFEDVSPTDYYYDAVNWATQNSITNGTSTTRFTPNNGCRTSEILTFLYRAAGSPSNSGQNSVGVTNKSSYYYNAVCWACDNNMIDPSTFSVNASSTRGDVIYYMWRAAGSPSVENNTSFTDLPSGDIVTAVAWAVQNGITNGTSATTFSPDKHVTRAQAVTFMYREQNN